MVSVQRRTTTASSAPLFLALELELHTTVLLSLVAELAELHTLVPLPLGAELRTTVLLCLAAVPLTLAALVAATSVDTDR